MRRAVSFALPASVQFYLKAVAMGSCASIWSRISASMLRYVLTPFGFRDVAHGRGYAGRVPRGPMRRTGAWRAPRIPRPGRPLRRRAAEQGPALQVRARDAGPSLEAEHISCISGSRRMHRWLDHLRASQRLPQPHRWAKRDIRLGRPLPLGKGDAACHFSAARARNGVTNAPRSCTSSSRTAQRVPRCFARAGHRDVESGRAEA